ncbi:hypothetical protein KSP40_PGU022066 [Platanthera guangdongensis]|uniref:Uncharacterized protein n=1 Tax=Platanthera guangdongensis TaxID=2320717 RepID=A0ABR2MSE4_9ASPA
MLRLVPDAVQVTDGKISPWGGGNEIMLPRPWLGKEGGKKGGRVSTGLTILDVVVVENGEGDTNCIDVAGSRPILLQHRIPKPTAITTPTLESPNYKSSPGDFPKNIYRTKQLFAARINQSAVAGVDLCTIYFNVADQQDKLKFFSYSLTFPLSSTTEGESEEEAREDSYKSRIARSVIQES